MAIESIPLDFTAMSLAFMLFLLGPCTRRMGLTFSRQLFLQRFLLSLLFLPRRIHCLPLELLLPLYECR